MTQVLTVHQSEEPIYNIRLEDSYQNLLHIFDRVHILGRKVCIVTDSNVGKLYLGNVKDILKQEASKVETFVFVAGEERKTLDTVKDLYEQLILSEFDRKDVLIALGGGVVGDLTGFVAGTYLRGIPYIQLPTSLLSMVALILSSISFSLFIALSIIFSSLLSYIFNVITVSIRNSVLVKTFCCLLEQAVIAKIAIINTKENSTILFCFILSLSNNINKP